MQFGFGLWLYMVLVVTGWSPTLPLVASSPSLRLEQLAAVLLLLLWARFLAAMLLLLLLLHIYCV